jgi:hypothetical protein
MKETSKGQDLELAPAGEGLVEVGYVEAGRQNSRLVVQLHL